MQAFVAAVLTFLVCAIGLALYLRKQRGQSTTDIAISTAFVATVSVASLGIAAFAGDLHRLLLVTVLSGVAISLTALARSFSIVPYGTPMLVLAFGAAAVVAAGAVFPATGIALFECYTLLAALAGLRGPFWVAAFPIASGLLVIPIADSATVFESRRKLKQPMFTPRGDHLSHRLLAVGFSSTATVAVLVAAAGIGATASCLTAFKIIPWYVGLCIAWATKITIVTWAIKHPVPVPGAEQSPPLPATS